MNKSDLKKIEHEKYVKLYKAIRSWYEENYDFNKIPFDNWFNEHRDSFLEMIGKMKETRPIV